jgi:hypothetical protein
MAAPNPVEIANLKTWSLYSHYFRKRGLYIGYGRAIVAGVQTMLRVTSTAQRATVTEDDIAAGLIVFLNKDANWLAYLGRKTHMTGVVKIAITDTMARFIAWEGYADMTK